ncbi:hypothetical protein DAPPUDRAFT_235259 [Daphnia pulex]|uniref:Uncharacterized protein n=1 Tax=Daphnia pulex TaxID=6669 RepID=E9FYL6_DAPPU|nr:hypothetical protein DAPPUDRAFT_235259 [Daphnia pulex]|eukprot:EFX87551.1 hypothetical protein DAPPUDRAFT_235259 [Daphnia pulex]
MNDYVETFVHDDDLLLRRPNIELLITALLDDAGSLVHCPASMINFTTIEIPSSDGVVLLFEAQQIAAQMDQFEGVVLAATQCRVADVIEAIVSSTMTPVLRLEFLFCPPSLPGLKAERLQLYRLNASHLIQHQFEPSSFHQYMYA